MCDHQTAPWPTDDGQTEDRPLVYTCDPDPWQVYPKELQARTARKGGR